MNLSDLPDIQFVDTDPETLRNESIAAFEVLLQEKLYPADPRRLFLLGLLNIIIQQRVLINSTAKQNLLRYASKDVLQHMGARVETPIIASQSAKTTQRFTLSAPQPGASPIPAGTRVGPDGNLFFQTKAYAEIPAGVLFADVEVECLTVGGIGNGFVAGQINILVDPLPFIASVSNLVTSSGGAAEEEADHYRERIRQAPEAFSVAGPELGYDFWARTADPDIIDLEVYSPSDGVVEIRPLMKGGNLPAPAVLDAITAICSAKTIRPMTDKFQAAAPTEVNYGINVTYWINKDDESNAASIQTAVNAAVTEYRLWQRSKLGRDINPDELRYLIRKAGAKRTVVTSPVFTVLTNIQKATENTPVTVTYGGLENA